MVRDIWEFLNNETKARVIFGAVLVAVILVVAIPYFVTVLNYHEPGVNMEVVEPEVSDEEAETENDEATEESVIEDNTEKTEETSEANEDDIDYVYYAPTGNAAATANQPVARTNPAKPVERVNKTTVDDRSAGDDGYTASGIDNPGTDDAMITDGGNEGSDAGGVNDGVAGDSEN